MHISSYSTIYALGHRAIASLLASNVVVEEKVDGSQFSMTRDVTGQLACRSKGQDLIVDAPEKMFLRAINTASVLALNWGWVYRCEYLQKPKHNTLAYGRVPSGHLALYDVETGPQCYLTPEEKAEEAARIGIDCVPLVYAGMVSDQSQLTAMLDRESFLGGQKIEGVVIKNYSQFTDDKKVAMAKVVCASFKEKNATNWRAENPTKTDVVQAIIAALKTEARWHKAVQHLRERGELSESPADIGKLIKEAQADIEKEERDWIANELLKHSIQQILRGSIAGLPEWYKGLLSESAFATKQHAATHAETADGAE